MNQAFELIKTIFERCLYFWPGQQLYFQLETILNQQTSYVHRAYWTYDENHSKWNAQKKDEGMFDVTSEVQQAFVDYFNLFGTKVIDFNHDTTHFKTLEDIVGPKKSRELLKVKFDYEKKLRKTIVERFLLPGSIRALLGPQANQDAPLYIRRQACKLVCPERGHFIQRLPREE